RRLGLSGVGVSVGDCKEAGVGGFLIELAREPEEAAQRRSQDLVAGSRQQELAPADKDRDVGKALLDTAQKLVTEARLAAARGAGDEQTAHLTFLNTGRKIALKSGQLDVTPDTRRRLSKKRPAGVRGLLFIQKEAVAALAEQPEVLGQEPRAQ